MIATLLAGLSSTRVGKWVAGAMTALAVTTVLILALLRRDNRLRRDGALAEKAQQADATIGQLQRADQADAAYRGDGGARQRLRDGTF